MSRPQTISIDCNALLQGIAAAFDADTQVAATELQAIARLVATGEHSSAATRFSALESTLATLQQGCRFDLRRFLGRDLTPSERNVARRRIRELEAEGLIEVRGRRATSVLITPAGRDRMGGADG